MRKHHYVKIGKKIMILLLFFVIFLEEISQGIPDFLVDQMFPYFTNDAKASDTSLLSMLILKENVNKEEEKNTTELAENTEAPVMEEVEETVSVSNPVVYSRADLESYDFLLSNFYLVDSTTTITQNELNGARLLDMDLTVNLEGTEPKILIYHTHGSEEFADSRPGVVEDTVIGVGDELARILEEEYQIAVYHDRTIYDQVNGKLDRNKAYEMSREGALNILKQYPSIEVVIDLHRDGVNENTRLVTNVNGKPTAKIMFFNGMSRSATNGDIDYLYNQYKQQNLAFSLQMQLKAKSYFPDFVRKIYLKAYKYNLDLKPRAVLVEVGGQTNTLEEAKNAMEPFAKILVEVLS